MAVRIPKSFAQELGLEAGSCVDMRLQGRGLLVEPADAPFTLDELLDGVTNANLHGEVDTGPAQGREAW